MLVDGTCGLSGLGRASDEGLDGVRGVCLRETLI